MRLLVTSLVVVVLSSGCRSRESSTVKDALYQGDAGSFLLSREGEYIMITPCAKVVKITSVETGKGCELAEGASVEPVYIEDFKRRVFDAFKLVKIDQAAFENFDEKKGDLDRVRRKAEEFEIRKEQLINDIKQMGKFIETDDNRRIVRKSLEELRRVLYLLEKDIDENELYQKDLDPANRLLMSIIDDLISQPGIFLVNNSSGNNVFHTMLNSYFTKVQGDFYNVSGSESHLIPSGATYEGTTEAFYQIWKHAKSSFYFTNILYDGSTLAVNWSGASKICSEIDSGDGPGHWRLPSKDVMQRLSDYGIPKLHLVGGPIHKVVRGLWTSDSHEDEKGNKSSPVYRFYAPSPVTAVTEGGVQMTLTQTHSSMYHLHRESEYGFFCARW
jgi:hypothetical protein